MEFRGIAFTGRDIEDYNNPFEGPNPWPEVLQKAEANQVIFKVDTAEKSFKQFFPEIKFIAGYRSGDVSAVRCYNCGESLKFSPSVLNVVGPTRAVTYISDLIVEHRKTCRNASQIVSEAQQRQTDVPEVKQFARKYTVHE